MRVQGFAEHLIRLIGEDDHPEIVAAHVKGKDYQFPSVLGSIEFANGATATLQVLRVTGAGVSGPAYTVPEGAW
jgi:hypothetical protein